MKLTRLTRRDLLRWGIISGGAILLPSRGGGDSGPGSSGSGSSGSGTSGSGTSGSGTGSSGSGDLGPSPATAPFVDDLPIPPVAQPVRPFPTLPDPADCVNVDGTTAFHVSGPRVVPPNTEFFRLTERPGRHSFHRDLPTNVIWGYDGMTPGPTFVARSGTPSLVRFVNELPEDDPVGIGEPITAIHRHGGFQPAQDDGYPLDTFCTGQSRDYFFPNVPDFGLEQNEHSTMWYHDHAIDITGENVYRGLAGFYLNFDEVDSGDERDSNPRALRLPSGEFDVGLVFQDRQFDRNGFLVFDDFDHNGFLGDKFLVNGVIQPFFRVQRRKYRFRCLNGSNARLFNFFLSSGQPFVAIATDDHLLERPVTVKNFILGPAERVEVIIDFSQYPVGTEVFLQNRLKQDDGRKPAELVSSPVPLLKFIVDRDPEREDKSKVPDVLRPVTVGPKQLLPLVKVKRTFKFDRRNGAWTINNEFFDENVINARVRRGTPEIWSLEAGGGWSHPVHIHLVEFFILSRDGKKPPVLERGRKDTVNIGAQFKSVKILVPFPEEFLGRFVFHCHNIEHEDMRMMGQYELVP